MARLPIVGSDDGTWGGILNTYLEVEHSNASGVEGTHKAISIPQLSLATDDAFKAKLTADHTDKYRFIIDADGKLQWGPGGATVGANQDTNLYRAAADTLKTDDAFEAVGNLTASNLKRGTGSPEGLVTGNVGDMFQRTDGSTGTTVYIKESGAGNTGWAAVVDSSASLSAHINDTTDAHAASAITNTPAGSIAASTVQAAINELDAEKAALASAVMDGDAAGGSLTGTYPNPTIAANAVGDTALRDSVGTSVIGRNTNTTGDPGDITAAFDGDVLRRSGTSLGFGTVATAGITDNAITNAKLRDSTGFSVIGRSAATNGDPSDILAGMSGDVLRLSGSTLGFGSITVSSATASNAYSVWGRQFSTGGSMDEIRAFADGDVLRRSGTLLDFGQIGTASLANDAVTYAKMQNVNATSVVGRSFNSSGDPEDIQAFVSGDVLRRSGTTLGFGQITDTSIAIANLDGTAGTYSMRTLGTGAQQAAAGNHTHTGLGDVVKITEAYLSTNTTITFSSIPNTYAHLLIIGTIDGDGSLNDQNLSMRFNADTAANYDYLRHGDAQGAYASAVSNGDSRFNLGRLTSANVVGLDDASSVEIWIPRYASTDIRKIFMSRLYTINADPAATAGYYSTHAQGRWRNTAAITSIDFATAEGHSFRAWATRVTLYGVKG